MRQPWSRGWQPLARASEEFLSEAGRLLLTELAAQIGAANRVADVAAVLKGLDALPPAQAQALVQALASLRRLRERTRAIVRHGCRPAS